MIERDNEIVGAINRLLREADQVPSKMLAGDDIYRKKVKTISFDWFSISGCLVHSTSLISALILAVGVRHVLPLPWFWIVLLTAGLAFMNLVLIRLMNWRARVPREKSLYRNDSQSATTEKNRPGEEGKTP